MRKTTEKEKRKTRWNSNDMNAHEEIKIATTNVDREWTRGSKGIGSVKKPTETGSDKKKTKSLSADCTVRKVSLDFAVCALMTLLLRVS